MKFSIDFTSILLRKGIICHLSILQPLYIQSTLFYVWYKFKALINKSLNIFNILLYPLFIFIGEQRVYFLSIFAAEIMKT